MRKGHKVAGSACGGRAGRLGAAGQSGGGQWACPGWRVRAYHPGEKNPTLLAGVPVTVAGRAEASPVAEWGCPPTEVPLALPPL